MNQTKIKISVSVNPGADIVTAIGQTLNIAKAAKIDLNLEINEYNYVLRVRQDSNIQDLIVIAYLARKTSKQ